MARFLIVVVLVQFKMIPARSQGSGNVTDLTALLDFKNRITDDPFGIMDSWNDSSHFCSWIGITCDPSGRRVRILGLKSKKLVGSLPPSLGNLSLLQGLDLRNNSFHGELPQEIGLLSSLKHLNMSRNMLYGSVPSNLSRCTKLTHLFLDSNKLSGQIPSQLGSLLNLEIFRVDVNNLTGPFPVWLGNLSSRFYYLSLPANNFHGSIPAELGQRLSGLQVFRVSVNQLSGELPSSIYNLSSMINFNVADNLLQGEIPADVGFKYPNLRLFAGGMNNFTGELPPSLANASQLALLDLSVNRLTGSVPSVLGRLPFLYWINFDGNLLGNKQTGDMNFISSLTNCTKLQVLSLILNNFGGELPSAVANLSSQLQILRLGNNFIHGNLPFGMGNLQSLRNLYLSRNFFTGAIPEDIGRLTRLNGLSLDSNELTGVIPYSLGNLTSLVMLYLNSNRLQGNIPPHLGNCTALLSLNISTNNLTGSIPKEVVSLSSLSLVLHLANNFLSGPLPVEVSKLTNLKGLVVYGNDLSGAIPSSLASCLSLEFLVMGRNGFTGTIPESLEALRGLEAIDFSHNNLSGKIPDFLGKLPFVTILDLSYNNLQGEVPNQGIFSNSTVVSVLGNKQLCGGAPSLNLPPCPTPAKKSNKNLKLIRWLIPVTVSAAFSIVLMCSLILWYILRKPKQKDITASPLNDSHLVISYRELHSATNGFSADNLIGSGSFGSVYKGTLDENAGSSVAVKVLNLEQRGAMTSFLHECEILRSIRHRNLLKIITVCSGYDPQGQEFKSLVTEFMANGSLDAWLHPTTRDGASNPARKLNIKERLNIAIDVASAVHYLHNHSHKPIIHCDLKPSNILLDEDLMAHVGDFGLAKFLLQSASRPLQNHSISVELRGSIGYIPPEYGSSTQISSLGDVYSYGILVLELFTGKRPTDNLFKDGMSIHKYVSMALPEHVVEIYEEREEEEGEIIEADRGREFQQLNIREKECLASVFTIGVSCSMPSAEDRLPMSNVVNQLHSIRARLNRPN